MPQPEALEQQQDDERIDYTNTLGDETEEDEAELTADEQEEQAAFAAAFSGERAKAPSSESPATTDEPEANQPAAAEEQPGQPGEEPAAPAAVAADPWADVNPVVRDTINALSAQMGSVQKLEHRLKSAEGRIAAINVGKQAAKDAVAAGGEAPDAKTIRDAAVEGGAAWKELADEWPQWAAAIEERISALPNTQPQSFDLDAVVEQVAQRTAVDPDTIVQHVTMEMKHPGWKQTLSTPEFKTWYQTAPADIRAAGASDRAADGIKVLDAFNEHASRAQQQSRTQSRLTNAIAPTRGVGRGGPVNQSEEQAFAAAFKAARSR